MFVSEFEIARDLHLEGRIQYVAGGNGDPGVAVNRHLTIIGREVRGVAGAPRFIFRTSSRAKTFISLKPATFRDIDLDFNGKLTLVGAGVVSSGSSFTNSGTVQVQPEPATQNQVRAELGKYEQKGGLTTLAPNAVLAAPQGIKLAGTVELSPNQLLSDRGLGLIGDCSACLVGQDGGTLVGLDGGTLVGLDGGTLVGLDGGTLLGPDGAPLIGNDGSTLVGLDGGTLLAPDSYASASKSGSKSSSAATAETADIILTAGTITGIGELRGEVLNQGGFISPAVRLAALLLKVTTRRKRPARSCSRSAGTLLSRLPTTSSRYPEQQT